MKDKNIEKAVNLTKFLSFPLDIGELLILSIAISTGVGALNGIIYGKGILGGIMRGIIEIFVPFLTVSLVSKIFFRKASMKQLIATSATGMVVYSIIYVIIWALLPVSGGSTELILAIGGSITFLIWLIVSMVLFRSKLRGVIFALIQFIIYLVFMIPSTNVSLGYVMPRFVGISIVMVFVLYIIYTIINAPLKRNFNVSSLDALSMFLGQWVYGTNELDRMLNKVGEPLTTFVHIISFKSQKGDNISTMVVPYIHYGPFGNLGGSDFPSKLSNTVGMPITSFHGTATHDMNPTDPNEISKIKGVVEKALKSKHTLNKAEISEGTYGNARATIISFGDNAIIFLTRSPKTTEDISLGASMYLLSIAKNKFKNVAIVDEHNSSAKDIRYFYIGSKEVVEYGKAIENAIKNIKGNKRQIYIGFSYIPSKSIKSKSIGGNGIHITVIKANKTAVIVTIDTNGISNDCKKRIEELIKKVDKRAVALVTTTDSHEMNAVKGVVNEFTCDIDMKRLEKAIKEAMKAKKAKASFISKEITINVLGPKQAIEIVTTVNSMVAVGRILIPLSLVGLILGLAYVVTKL